MPARLCRLTVPLLLLAAAACADSPAGPPADPPRPPGAASSLFDPAATGGVAGVVLWRGELPAVKSFRYIPEPLTDKPAPPPRDWANPNAPRIDPNSRALAGAVVFLRGVEVRKARPWDHPAARVEMRGQGYVVVQGKSEANVGFVRAGDPVEFVSRDDRLHVAQARGAAFFSIALPKPDRARSRRFEKAGLAELLGGSGYFWMRAYLHVADHPYFALTDARGRFRLDQVPAGEYELVAWHPHWRVSRRVRNPELFRVQQVHFAPPLEAARRVRVTAGGRAEVDLSLADVQP